MANQTWSTANIPDAQTALDQLSDLQNAAVQAGDITTLQSLQHEINDLTVKLTRLRASDADAADNEAAALNTQLAAVTAAATAAEGDLSKIDAVLTAIGQVTTTISGIITAV